ncbi:hypothetical protein FNF31_00034 [Cafeteria roenbergensis]|uniref:Proteasome subunit beta n=2 Tax=Cafeteria roenbergensis TaxID=33653 RepID=A0A5A8DTZ5_CAFRO|nr:hypothetical protein FNF31_00034 [Cafeteria roenbergensis]
MAAAAMAPKLTASSSTAKELTTHPIVTGSSVLAVKFAGGVMMASDTLASYGSMARFPDVQRLRQVSDGVIIGASGEMSDFDFAMRLLDELRVESECAEDGAELDAGEVHHYLTRVMYNRRNKFNPLWNQLVVAGTKDGKPVLGVVDQIGTAFEADFTATGFGKHMAVPQMREHWRADMTEGEARELLEGCMRVLFYRDCRTINRMQIAKVTATGSVVSPAYSLDTEWSLKSFKKEASPEDGSW